MIYIGILIIIFYMLIIIWFASGIIKNNSIINDGFLPGISVIISAHNEEKYIGDLLSILVNQTYRSNYEIIIANDRSTDNTKKIILEYKKNYQTIELIDIIETPIGWGNKKWALNKCIDKAQYDIILQTDADCLPKETWIESMSNQFADPNVIFISGPSPLIDNKNKLSEYYKLDSLAQDALSASGMTHNLIFSCTGRNMGFLKESFLKINGYENIEHYISGDDDLLLQKFSTLLDGKIMFSFNPESVVESKPPQSINIFLNQRIRYASKGFDYYKLNTTMEFKVLLPFLYIVNAITLLSLIIFIQKMNIIYLFPILLKSIGDYWLCSIFFDKIKESLNIKKFIILSIIHPIYVSSLGILSPLITYKWKNDD